MERVTDMGVLMGCDGLHGKSDRHGKVTLKVSLS
jgi:hypothetical protein